jgi:hypothetical protein
MFCKCWINFINNFFFNLIYSAFSKRFNTYVYIPSLYTKIANICIKPFTKSRINQVKEDIIYKVDPAFAKHQLEKHL